MAPHPRWEVYLQHDRLGEWWRGVGFKLVLPRAVPLRARACGADTAALIGAAHSYLIGSIAGGWIFDHWDGNKGLAAFMLMAGVGTFLVPVVKHVWLLALCVSATGMAMGVIDTGCVQRSGYRLARSCYFTVLIPCLFGLASLCVHIGIQGERHAVVAPP